MSLGPLRAWAGPVPRPPRAPRSAAAPAAPPAARLGANGAFQSSLALDPPCPAAGPRLPGGVEEEGATGGGNLGRAGAVGVDLHQGVAVPEGRVLRPDERQADVGQALAGRIPAGRKLRATGSSGEATKARAVGVDDEEIGVFLSVLAVFLDAANKGDPGAVGRIHGRRAVFNDAPRSAAVERQRHRLRFVEGKRA